MIQKQAFKETEFIPEEWDLVKVGEVSEKTRDGVVKKYTIKYTIRLLPSNERTVFDEMQSNPKVTANELSKILDINLRNTKKVIEKLNDKGLVERMGSRKLGHWEVVDR